MSGWPRVGDFILEEKLAEGGMGVVYRARQVALDRWVALKFLSRHAALGPEYVERFYREARAAAQLVHPNIVQIYTVGQHEKIPYFAMEYVEGVDLKHALQAGPLGVDEALELVRSVTKALVAAAEQQIVHRDIKPSNIMVTLTGLVKVMDFGLAKAGTTAGHQVTWSGQLVGTPAYLSPEQALGMEVDARSDLYSLGCVFYECLTGRPPFQADHVAGLIFKHAYEAVEPPSQYASWTPEPVEAICLKLLAKGPEERFQSAVELVETLRSIPVDSAKAEAELARRARELFAAAPRPSPAAAPETARAPARSSVGPPAARKGRTAGLHPGPDPAAPKRPAPAGRGGTAETPRGAPAPGGTAPPGATRLIVQRALFYKPSAGPQSGALPFGPPATPSATPSAAPAGTPPATPPGPASATPPLAPIAKESRHPKGVFSYFRRLADERWSYDASKGHCAFAEGLATADFLNPDAQIGALGDCLICSNWSTSYGCAIASAQDVLSSSTALGVALLEAVAAIWQAAGRYDRMVLLFEEHLKEHTEDAAAYRALARLYDHPDNPERNRSRALALFDRFVKLASLKGGFTPLEIRLAEQRRNALRTGQPGYRRNPLHSVGGLESLQVLRCFYRQAHQVCFALGVLFRESLRLARVGDTDPETGLTTSDLPDPSTGTATLPRAKRPPATAAEREGSRKEMERLAQVPVDTWSHQASPSLHLPLTDIVKVGCAMDTAAQGHTLTLQTAAARHELIFAAPAGEQAERCALLLKRLTGR